MQKILMIVHAPPYGSERVLSALRLATALVSQEEERVDLSVFMMSDPISVIADSLLSHPVSSSFSDVLPEFFSSRKYGHKKDSADTFFSHFTLSSLFCPYLFPQFFLFSLYFFHFF